MLEGKNCAKRLVQRLFLRVKARATHPQTSHNPINLDFLLDPLSKSEFLSLLFIILSFCSKRCIIFLLKSLISLTICALFGQLLMCLIFLEINLSA